MRNWLTRPSRAASTEAHQPEREAAAAEIYVFRLRHQGASIADVAADIHVSPRALRTWVDAYWTKDLR